MWKTETFGVGFTEHIKNIIASTSTKIKESMTPVEEDLIPAIDGADDRSVYSKVSRFSVSSFFKKK